MKPDFLPEGWDEIEGWFNRDEAAFLYQQALIALKATNGQPLVEIGSFHGRSTVVLAQAARHFDSYVIAIDPHEGYIEKKIRTASTWDVFQSTLKRMGVAEWVQPQRCRSEDAVLKQAASLGFIDGLHNYKSVAGDYQRLAKWTDRLAFHDYSHPPIAQLLSEIADEWTVVGTIGGLRVLCRR